MRCVSYTRTTCFDPTVDVGEKPLTDQRDRIQAFAKKHHWRIANRYTDRLSDPKINDGFQQFKADALNRKFDCVIADSVYYFGADTYQTIHFLKRSFCPAGLQFAFVDDGFYSGEHSREEIYQYLDEKRAEIHGKLAKVKMLESSVESYFSVYGFRYYKDEHRVTADPHAAEIIQEIYTRLNDGEKPGEIAADLTARGEESPSDYFCRQRGWPPRSNGREWNNKSIRTISTNEKYTGKWDCSYDPEKLQIDCGAIVDKALFDSVQKITHGRYRQLPTKRQATPYSNLMWDKESGMKVVYFCNHRTKHNDIRFHYPKEKDIKYERQYMPYEEFHDKAQAALMHEKELCDHVCRMMETEVFKAWKAGKISEMQATFSLMLDKMTALENSRMEAYRERQLGEISLEEYKTLESEYMRQLCALDDRTEQLYEEIEEFKMTYSEMNPWIRLFNSYDKSKKMTRMKTARYVDKLLVYRFESVELVPQELEWKNVFPQEWLEVDEDGKTE